MATVLIVGAGFAGSVLGRELADAGRKVHIIDKRHHIGGNAFDKVNQYGERIHKYGPHLIHSDKSSPSISWLSRFTEWTPYEHKVRALLPNGKTTPLPVNRSTLEDVFGISLATEVDAKKFLENEIVRREVKNADDFFVSSVGERLADLFFRPYTTKMWGVSPTELEASVGARLPVRINRDDRYFTDTFQAMPTHGFTHMFQNILDHKNIKITLNEPYMHKMARDYCHVFTSSPIDLHYDNILGKLPYRSVMFESLEKPYEQDASTINFTDFSKYTRITQWDLIANSGRRNDGLHTCTKEIPCDPEINNDERYYPVRNEKSISLYNRYKELASKERKISFIGRTGLFVYIDMMPCVSSHLEIARRYLAQS